MVIDWRTMQDGKEKYQAYLCSENWWWRRAAVKERCGGICEKCHKKPMAHAHHQTYIRKYAEQLTDLLGVCEDCHREVHCAGTRPPVPSTTQHTESWPSKVGKTLKSDDPRCRSLLRIQWIRTRAIIQAREENRRWIELKPST